MCLCEPSIRCVVYRQPCHLGLQDSLWLVVVCRIHRVLHHRVVAGSFEEMPRCICVESQVWQQLEGVEDG